MIAVGSLHQLLWSIFVLRLSIVSSACTWPLRATRCHIPADSSAHTAAVAALQALEYRASPPAGYFPNARV